MEEASASPALRTTITPLALSWARELSLKFSISVWITGPGWGVAASGVEGLDSVVGEEGLPEGGFGGFAGGEGGVGGAEGAGFVVGAGAGAGAVCPVSKDHSEMVRRLSGS